MITNFTSFNHFNALTFNIQNHENTSFKSSNQIYTIPDKNEGFITVQLLSFIFIKWIDITFPLKSSVCYPHFWICQIKIISQVWHCMIFFSANAVFRKSWGIFKLVQFINEPQSSSFSLKDYNLGALLQMCQYCLLCKVWWVTSIKC